mmetsp:Transcript_30338/g.46414  ORF Transcript_30338/g.46414 Transcript_30338/m.46414 type:complete len:147 (+) Transcript_30338:9459-9899(+)
MRGAHQAPQQTPASAKIAAHSSTCTVIASTVDDPNKIALKNYQQSALINNTADGCLVITGSKSGDVIVWKYNADPNVGLEATLQKQRQFFDHSDHVTSIFIHQDMQYFATASLDGTANLYNLWHLELLRCFRHPSLSPISSVVLSY